MTALPPGRIVVDASFLIAIADTDADAARFVHAMDRFQVTAVNFGEVCYKLHQRSGMDAARTTAVFTGLKVDVVPVELADAQQYPRLKDIDAASRDAQLAAGVPRPGVKSLSLADMTCLAHAMTCGDRPVLTGDDHWSTLSRYGLTVPVFSFRDADLHP